MFCLRSWLPLLFIPTNASPLFIFLFLLLTYLLHRPCVYCSLLLGILFLTSCSWSPYCAFDLSKGAAGIFEPRIWGDGALGQGDGWGGQDNGTLLNTHNGTTPVLRGPLDSVRDGMEAVTEVLHRRLASVESEGAMTGEGKRWKWAWVRDVTEMEWRLPLLDVKIKA